MTRKQIRNKIAANEAKIKALKTQNIELVRQDYLHCDKKQWFTEKTETVKIGRTKKELLIGRINWVSEFVDEDDGQVIEVPRSQIVRVDGEWDF